MINETEGTTTEGINSSTKEVFELLEKLHNEFANQIKNFEDLNEKINYILAWSNEETVIIEGFPEEHQIIRV